MPGLVPGIHVLILWQGGKLRRGSEVSTAHFTLINGKLERIESEWISRAAVVFPLPASPVISTGTSVCESNSACVRSRRVAGLAAIKYNSSLMRSISG